MFRHFVAITLLATGLLALFATGENSEAFEQQLAEKRERNELKQAELELAKNGKGGNTALVFKDNRRTKSSWGPDIGQSEVNDVPADGEGSPELVADSGPQFIDLPGTAGQQSGQVTVAPPGMSGQDIAAIQKRKKARAGLQAVSHHPPPPEEGEEE